MKFASTLIAAAAAVSAVAAAPLPDVSKVPLGAHNKVLQVTEKAHLVGKPAVDNVGITLCPVCVEFIGTAYNDLLNLILNGTVQTCSDLCEQLSGNLLPTVCTLVCDYVGIKEFIKVISESNGPDEIYICTKLHTCEECLGEAAFESLHISPAEGPSGTTFSFETTYNVTKKTCAGELGIEIQGPDSFPMGSADLYEGQIPGVYSTGWSLQATPSQQDPFSPGTYQVEVFLCSGACQDSKDPNAKVLSTKQASFKITG